MTETKLKELIKVIKAVKKLGVIRLKLGTLEFELDKKDDIEPSVHRPTLKVSKKKIAEQDTHNQLQLRLDSMKEELSTMHVEDPSGFEASLVENDLIDDTNENAAGDYIEETQTQ
jgi:hypothetical protein